ncbi:MAG: OmpA family protein [Polyangiaceae bacterium]|nr:OmpA family protein [Polyangiaceae bacterium]
MHFTVRLCRLSMSGLALVFLVFSAGCTPSDHPPPELLSAREVFERAKTGPASQVNPAGVFEADKALDTAEQRHQKKPGSPEARDLAYIALRKSQQADVDTRAMLADAERKRQKCSLHESIETRIADEGTQTKENVERSTHANAEGKAKAELAGVAGSASVKDDSRGMVVTIAGSTLFAPNDAALVPSADDPLNVVAAALTQTPDRRITVYGYTDTAGSDEGSMDLSQRRAEAVRLRLVSRGIAHDRIRAEGRGKNEPIASNATSNGRAANRRVEIVVEP